MKIVEFDFSMGTVHVIVSFFWTDNAPCLHPWLPQFVKLLISIVKKKLNENYAEFDFSMSTVLVIFSFFWTDNDLVCAPPFPSGMFPFLRCHNYSHTFVHNPKTTCLIFVELWEIATNNMTVTNLQLTQ